MFHMSVRLNPLSHSTFMCSTSSTLPRVSNDNRLNNKFVADADGLRRAKSLDLRPLRLFFVPNVLHMTEVAREDALQDAELGLID